MDFELWGVEKYRSLSIEELETRKADITAELSNADSEFSTEQLRDEVNACVEAIKRCNAEIELRNASIHAISMGAGKVIERSASAPAAEETDGDETSSVEYRKAFMGYVQDGIKSEILKRDNASTTTSDAASVVPTVLVNRIVEKMESTGMILPLVTRTSYKAGVEIPTSSMKPVASWVSEGAGSDRQKKTTGKITFTYHKLRCEVSMSMEMSVMALAAFESKFVENVSEAMVKALEAAILSGTGTGQPKGILTETPASGQAIELAYNTAISFDTAYDAWAALPQAYEGNVKWCMTKKTFIEFAKVKDSDGHPIASWDFSLGAKPVPVLLGTEVVLCGDYMSSYTKTPTADTVFAFLFNFQDYALNTVYDMGIQRKQDWDTEDMLTKAVMSVDGKCIDTNSLVTLKIKKNSTGA